MADSFVHLHLHSEYSLLDGGNRLTDLAKRVKELGMSAVAVTDHGNLFGAMEFYYAAKAEGVKPILGIEAYVAPGDRRDRTHTGVADGGFHLVLLAENLTGWRNLMRLSSDAYLVGHYYKPRMDKETLSRWADGVISINGHLGSSIAYHLTNLVRTGDADHYARAVAEARWHFETFRPDSDGKPRFFVELQRHVPEQEAINPHLIRLARELELPLVADNDAHFLRSEDWDVHDTLCCISMQKTKDSADRLRYSEELYVKSPEQMRELFADVPEAVTNSARIAERCNVELPKAGNHAPVVRVRRLTPDDAGAPSIEQFHRGSTEWFTAYCSQFELLPVDRSEGSANSDADLKQGCDEALRALAEAGLIWRYGDTGATPDIRERLDRELRILADKMISAYFLIVWDFVNWARQRGIPANARGSGVGTMVGYVLGLSNACPVKYGLLFERFTDPDRSEYPDIDIDLCQDGRADVINYVRQKYGYVAQIITFGRLKAKAAIKDVARVMGLSPTEGQRLSNLVPNELHITIDEALQKEPDLRSQYDADDRIRRVIDSAKALEDHARHAGVHAAGVVIATQPLENIVPLYRPPGSDDVVTQWDGPTCEKLGLLKMDFLGLRTLSTIELAKKLIRQTLPEVAVREAADRGRAGVQTSSANLLDPLDLDRLEFTDQRVFDLFRRGDTSGIFQFESPGMRKLLVDMKPDRLEDLIAANALFRPGPMDLIPDYCARKHHRQPVPKVHPVVDRYTEETYGIMVYQEQVMQVLHGLGGVPLRAAYTIIKAISKKKHDVINAARADFVRGAADQGVAKAKAEELFELILKFAGYGFNKSHSTGYAIIAYQTAWLKTYFPNQYMAAVLTYESQARKVEDWAPYLEDCRRTVFPDHSGASPHVGLKVEPPDINLSEAAFSVVFEPDEQRDALHGHIRFGLGAIKGTGDSAVHAILGERRERGAYESIFDFADRVDLRGVNKATIEALIKAGAFDSLHGVDQRAALVASIDDIISAGQQAARDRDAGQMNFFGTFAESAPATKVAPRLRSEPAWDHLARLAAEKDALGFHISGHPLDRYRDLVREFCNADPTTLSSQRDGGTVIIGGVVTSVRHMVTKRGASAGSKMARVVLDGGQGVIEGVAFAESFARNGHLLIEDAMVIVVGSPDRNSSEPGVIIEQVYAMETAPLYLAQAIEIHVDASSDDEPLAQLLQMAVGMLRQSSGLATLPGAREVDVFVHLSTHQHRVTLRPERLRAVPDRMLLTRLRELFGEGSVQVRGGFIPTIERRRSFTPRAVPIGA